MSNKYIILIYKKFDGTISKKELNKLNKKLEQDSKLREEDKIISKIFEEFKNTQPKALPKDYSVILKKRISDYNLNKKDQKAFQFPVFRTAMVLATVFLIVFSLNYNLALLPKTSNNISEYQSQHNEPAQIDNGISNEEQPPIMLSRAVPSLPQSQETIVNENILTADVEENKYNTSTITEDSPEDKKQKEFFTINNESAQQTNDLSIDSDNTKYTEEKTLSGASGGGSSNWKTNNILSPVIKCKSGVFEFLQIEGMDKQLSFPINRFEELKEKLKDYIITIENDNNINAEYFKILEMEY